jgi:hypothetical protein
MAADVRSSVVGRWRALGIAFDARPSGHDPDLERLLLDTARALPAMPRLLPMVATWLQRYGDAVARHRLRRLAVDELAPEGHPALGVLLESADEGLHPARFPMVLKDLRPAAVPQPLFEVESLTPSLRERARRRASACSRRWGGWCEPVEFREDVLEPAQRVLRRHPWLRLAADFRGDLRASVIAALRHDPEARDSEVGLAHAAGGSRAQVRNALANLELTGRATRTREPGVRRTRIAVGVA